MKAYLITAIVLSGFAVLVRGAHLMTSEYPRTTKTGMGTDVFGILLSFAYIFWAALLLNSL